MTDEVPEYVTEAEKELWDWGTRSPLACVTAFERDSPEEELKILENEIQYHLGAFTAAEFTLNRLYNVAGMEERFYDEPVPWLEEAVEYQRELEEEIEDAGQ